MKTQAVGLLIGGVVSALLLQGCATGLSLPALRGQPGQASSQGEHERFAATYRKDAAQLRKRAAYHTTMLERMRTYPTDGTLRDRESWIAHCEYLIKKYTEAAEAADAMATAHQQDATASESR